MRRGEIWWAELEAPTGSEPGYKRPVVVVSNNIFNSSGFRSVLAVPLTSNLTHETAPGNVRLPTRGTGLSKASVAIPIQVIPTDKRRFLNQIGRVPDDLMSKIDDGLRLVLAL